MSSQPQPPNLQFIERVPLPTGRHRYDMIDTIAVETPAGDFRHWAVPAIGDTFVIGGNSYRVTDRTWMYPHRGSVAWPAGQQYADTGPIITLICESDPGPFTNEATQEQT